MALCLAPAFKWTVSEREKERKRERERGGLLIPFCLNTHGGFHSEAVKFCKTLAAFAADQDGGGRDYAEAIRFIVTFLTYSLHRNLGQYIDSAINHDPNTTEASYW